jgi:hypothetical protein
VGSDTHKQIAKKQAGVVGTDKWHAILLKQDLSEVKRFEYTTLPLLNRERLEQTKRDTGFVRG